MMQVSVIIPHYNSPDTLGHLLTQLSSDSFDNVIVLDDYSDDTLTLKNIANSHRNVQFVYGEENLGAGGNRNRALKLGLTGIVWFLDCDMEVLSLENGRKLRELFASNQRQMIGGTILTKAGQQMSWNYGHEMNKKDDMLFFDLVKRKEWDVLADHGWDYPWLHEETIHEFREVDWVAEGSFALSIEDFQRINGYDTVFRYHEGQDLARRLRNIGVKILASPEPVTRHLEVEVRKSRREQDRTEAAEYFYKKHGLEE